MKEEIFHKFEIIVNKEKFRIFDLVIFSFFYLDNLPRNPYFVCRAFWNEEPITSVVCWGSSSPRFNFEQVFIIECQA